MVVILVAALILACVLGHVFHDQAHRRLERNSARFLDALIAAGERSQRNNEAHRAEVQTLLQRIQAPQAAVAAQYARDVPAVAENPMPMTDEEVAEQQERDRVISFIEAAENGRLSLYDGTPE